MRHRAPLPALALTCALSLVGCGQQTGQEVSLDPAATRVDGTNAIPDDFPLSAGMGAPGDEVLTARTGTGLRDLELCGTAPLRGLGSRDRMVADNSGGEALDTRELILMGSPEEAARLARSFADLPTKCDTPSPAQDLETVTEVRGSAFGRPSPAATLLQTHEQRGEPVPGAMVVHVVPTGAALLVTVTYGDWAGEALDEGVAETADAVGRTVAALELFGDDTATPVPSDGTEQPDATGIPDDFPLLTGWPEDSTAEAGGGRRGPTRSADSLEFSACDRPWQEPDHVDRLRADWVNAEDYRSRQLTTYVDDAAAVAAIEGLVAEQRGCPSEPPGEDGFATVREVRPVALGDEAWAILERDTVDGSPSPFGGSALVVRVGLAVLAVRHEGHAGYPAGDGKEQVAAMGSQAEEAIANMCVFTRTGC